jgi:hypothetical protein
VLRRLLALIASDGENWSVATLARELDVPPTLVDDLLARLARDGYLVCATMGEDASPCAHCAVRIRCHTAGGAAMWQISDKGQRLLQTAEGSST